MSDAMNSSLFDEELEALEAIYMDDLEVSLSQSSETTLQITLHPNTADNDEMKFVCLTLVCNVPLMYPEKEPTFLIKNPRGISDAHITSIKENLSALSLQKIGEVMLFDLLEYAKDSLTDNNHPSCVCPICLEHFKEDEDFFRTECYHYYHFLCIKGYIGRNEETYVCPVCRFEINKDDVTTITNYAEKSKAIGSSGRQTNNTYVTTKEYQDWLKSCKTLFEKQQRNGGIIDLEYEKNKFLISADTNFSVTTLPTDSNDESEQDTELTSSVIKKTGSDYKHHKQEGSGNKSPSSSQNERNSKSTQKYRKPHYSKPPLVEKEHRPHENSKSKETYHERNAQPSEVVERKPPSTQHERIQRPPEKSKSKKFVKEGDKPRVETKHPSRKHESQQRRSPSNSSQSNKEKDDINKSGSRREVQPPSRKYEPRQRSEHTDSKESARDGNGRKPPSRKNDNRQQRPPEKLDSTNKDRKTEANPPPPTSSRELQVERTRGNNENKHYEENRTYTNLDRRKLQTRKPQQQQYDEKGKIPALPQHRDTSSTNYRDQGVTPVADGGAASPKKTVRPPPGFKPLS